MEQQQQACYSNQQQQQVPNADAYAQQQRQPQQQAYHPMTGTPVRTAAAHPNSPLEPLDPSRFRELVEKQRVNQQQPPQPRNYSHPPASDQSVSAAAAAGTSGTGMYYTAQAPAHCTSHGGQMNMQQQQQYNMMQQQQWSQQQHQQAGWQQQQPQQQQHRMQQQYPDVSPSAVQYTQAPPTPQQIMPNSPRQHPSGASTPYSNAAAHGRSPLASPHSAVPSSPYARPHSGSATPHPITPTQPQPQMQGMYMSQPQQQQQQTQAQQQQAYSGQQQMPSRSSSAMSQGQQYPQQQYNQWQQVQSPGATAGYPQKPAGTSRQSQMMSPLPSQQAQQQQSRMQQQQQPYGQGAQYAAQQQRSQQMQYAGYPQQQQPQQQQQYYYNQQQTPTSQPYYAQQQSAAAAQQQQYNGMPQSPRYAAPPQPMHPQQQQQVQQQQRAAMMQQPQQQQQHYVTAQQQQQARVPSQMGHRPAAYQTRPTTPMQHPGLMSPTGSAGQQGYLSQQQQQHYAQQQQQQHRAQYFGHDPTLTVPPELCLVGCVFVFVLDERAMPVAVAAECKLIIELYGGVVDSAYSVRCTHVLTNSIQHPSVRQALKDQKRCVTPQWLNDVLAQKRMCPPWKVAHLPCLYHDNSKPARGKLFTITPAFDTSERECIKQMIQAVGGRFTAYLTNQHNFVIAKSMNDGPKIQRACDWRVPVVNVRWLTELCVCYPGVLDNYAHDNYRRFLVPPANQSILCLDPSAFETIPGACQMLIVPWRQPISVTQEAWQAANKRRESTIKGSQTFNPQQFLKSPALSDSEVEERSKKFSADNSAENAAVNRIAFSGFNEAELLHWTQCARAVCCVLAENVAECTHLVLKDLRRTHHLLEALALGKHIVSTQWLMDCAQANSTIDPTGYAIRDEESESFFGFNLRQSLARACDRRLFQDMVFYVTPSVAPSRAVVVDLIGKAGGKALTSRPAGSVIAKHIQDGTPFIVISCDADIGLCTGLIECNIVIHSVEFVLTGLLRQQADQGAFVLSQSNVFGGRAFVEQ